MILVAVLGFGLLAAAAFAGYWYGSESAKIKEQSAKPQLKTQIQETPTPTPTVVEDETAGWKTYTDTRFGYSMKYPKDATINTPEDCVKEYVPRAGFGAGSL